jgi:hypothetical protein
MPPLVSLLKLYFDRLCTPAYIDAKKRLRAMGRSQSKHVSNARVWMTVFAQVLATCLFFHLIHRPLELFWLAAMLFGYTFFVAAVTLSFLMRLPLVRKLWSDVATKVAILAVPIYLLYVSKGYAGIWVGEIVGVSAVNAPSAHFAGSVMLLCVVAAFMLMLLCVAFELALVLALTAPKINSKWWGFVFLFGAGFVSLLFAYQAIAQLPSSRLGNRLLAAIVFEFDAAPAHFCALTVEERALADRPEPIIQALYLSSSQESALLIKRFSPLFRPVVISQLTTADVRTMLQPLRVVDCFKRGK